MALNAFADYVSRYTDLPFLITLTPSPDGSSLVPGKFLTSADLPELAGSEDAEWKTVLLDEVTDKPVVPNGSMGFRYSESGKGKWNLELGDVKPRLSLYESGGESAEVQLPCFEAPDGSGSAARSVFPLSRASQNWA